MVLVVVADVAVTLGVGELAARLSWLKVVPSYTPLQTQESSYLASMCCPMSQVVGRRVMLGVVVCHIGCAFVPVKTELSLGGAAA